MKEADYQLLKGQNILLLQELKKCTFNSENLFVYDNHRIHYYNFKKRFEDENKHELGFRISPQEKSCFIKNVLACDKSNNLAIVVE